MRRPACVGAYICLISQKEDVNGEDRKTTPDGCIESVQRHWSIIRCTCTPPSLRDALLVHIDAETVIGRVLAVRAMPEQDKSDPKFYGIKIS